MVTSFFETVLILLFLFKLRTLLQVCYNPLSKNVMAPPFDNDWDGLEPLSY